MNPLTRTEIRLEGERLREGLDALWRLIGERREPRQHVEAKRLILLSDLALETLIKELERLEKAERSESEHLPDSKRGLKLSPRG